MGVPRFFRWLSERYPMINQATGLGLKPEFDCMYLDMNGIVHNCTHANGGIDEVLTEDQMFVKIFQYIDRLFSIVRPKKLMYMAIDGVAPRAKMNQQRQRRFRSALAAQESAEKAAREGIVPRDDPFDSNCITPGTAFMERLSAHLQYFVRSKIQSDAAWQGIEVIFSGAEVVGEGEHKIMAYLRNQRMQPGYNPNLRHCLYGLDADLIMLSLVTHEHHVSLLREEVIFGPPTEGTKRKALVKPDEFQFLHINILREYLELEFRNDAMPFAFDLERVIDDWVFLCYLVGNDFLPSVPTIDIAEGGLSTLADAYKALLPRLGGYVTHWGTLNVKRFVAVLSYFAAQESTVFEKRAEEAAKFAERSRDGATPSWSNSSKVARLPMGKASRGQSGRPEDDESAAAGPEVHKYGFVNGEFCAIDADGNKVDGAELPKESRANVDLPSSDDENENEDAEPSGSSPEQSPPVVRVDGNDLIAARLRAAGINIDSADERLHELAAEYDSGDMNVTNYYRRKFPEFYAGTQQNAELPAELRALSPQQHITRVCHAFFEGLCWCMKYYYSGVQSWRWHYPYRYAPLASSLINAGLPNVSLNFEIGTPFTPLEQLMGVLPPGSAKLLPPAWRHLMTDPNSEVKDFYPDTFEIDREGCRNPWEGVSLISFIDEVRLLDAIKAIPIEQLSKQERNRNRNVDSDWIFTYDPTNDETYTLASGFSTFADASTANATYLPNLSVFPNLKKCHSRAAPYRLPAIPSAPAWADNSLIAVLSYLNGEDAKLLNITYTAHEPAVGPAAAARQVGEGRFLPIALPGAVRPVAGFPSLYFVPEARGAVAVARVNLFGRDSRNTSLAVRCSTEHTLSHADGGRVARQFPVASRVFCDYPNLREALVVRVQDESTTWDLRPSESGQIFGRPSTHRERADYVQAVRDIGIRHSRKQALEVGAPHVIVFARPLLGMQRASDGSTRKLFAADTLTNSPTGYESDYIEDSSPSSGGGRGGHGGRGGRGGHGGRNNSNSAAGPGSKQNPNMDRVMAYAAQTVFAAHPTNRADPRWAELPPLPPQEQFPVGTAIVHIGQGFYGSPGEVTGVEVLDAGTKKESVRLTLNVVKRPVVPPSVFHKFVSQGELRYFPSYMVSRQLGIHGAALANLCATLTVEPGPADIGLNLTFSRYGLCVPDYARRVRAWQASIESEQEAYARYQASGAGGKHGGRNGRDAETFGDYDDNAGADEDELRRGGKHGRHGHGSDSGNARVHATRQQLEEHGAIRTEERGAGEQWEYSELTVLVLEEMKKHFPDLFKYLNDNPYRGRINARNFTPAGITAEDYISNILKFIKGTAISSLVAVSCTSSVAPARSCLLVESRARDYVVRLHDAMTGEKHVPPASFDFTKEVLVHGKTETVTASPDEVIVVNTAPAWSPTAPRGKSTSTADYVALGDRVVTLRTDHGVPVGLHGTVVAIHGAFVEVAFDLPFTGGTQLNGKCIDPRGKLVPLNSVLNLSNPRPVMPQGSVEAAKRVPGAAGRPAIESAPAASAAAAAAAAAASVDDAGKQQPQQQQPKKEEQPQQQQQQPQQQPRKEQQPKKEQPQQPKKEQPQQSKKEQPQQDKPAPKVQVQQRPKQQQQRQPAIAAAASSSQDISLAALGLASASAPPAAAAASPAAPANAAAQSHLAALSALKADLAAADAPAAPAAITAASAASATTVGGAYAALMQGGYGAGYGFGSNAGAALYSSHGGNQGYGAAPTGAGAYPAPMPHGGYHGVQHGMPPQGFAPGMGYGYGGYAPGAPYQQQQQQHYPPQGGYPPRG